MSPAHEIPARHDGLAEALGVEYLERREDLVQARAPVTDLVRQQYGVVHGGAYATIAESICSLTTAEAVAANGMRAMGQANSATFLRPILEGRIHATGRRIHAGRTTWLWDVEITDDDGRLCAVVRLTIAVRPG